MNAGTGRALAGADHLRQSIADVLMTPIGTRIGRRDYGSLVPELIDQPANAAGRLRLFAAAAIALLAWEPRLRVSRFTLTAGDRPGAVLLGIEGRRTDVAAVNARTQLTVPLVASGVLPA
ncbi:GPW/gp25 family protein [Sphingomonas jatrophae]|uniref:IraD/Gp25-like domain-containing protein n=1 Tax=Sphingomonas jatrophae TaxID=1166337 RepID=A0A1I6JLE8_9SPHN|nr:hypothetical protein SAMN05192580_0453 [Sphingomonas jatrophae]